ncbi:MAG TPA: methyltransferase [Longimicrobiaceae bacterium]|nr:methyltransferase [Longimicrobiaceae bacterium]
MAKRTDAGALGGSLGGVIRWVHNRRPLLTAIFVVGMIAYVLWRDLPPLDLLTLDVSGLFLLVWAIVIAGVAIRIWGSGNLRKNREITRTGIYCLVRHPLYTGSLLVFLGFFLSVGAPIVGLVVFLAMVILVYYPTMMSEEAHLASKFPEQADLYVSIPRLIPDPRHLPEAIRTERFTFEAARKNLGLRSLWTIVLLPLFLELLRFAQRLF